ncbi:hypothetical protein [Asticcacaulis sp. EMRT-3]|uniref:hypothetical protein n=1 Tax=Asticcacaulis sp. EMRT-3 TaxID=3040349 RepID=UPI0024AEF159|nr:hypothetical protein [Asticcacaulis sp. EMRT-3]MDI7776266.1 hypothetical protein [Asticcacaulis sp. EMRT-3]
MNYHLNRRHFLGAALVLACAPRIAQASPLSAVPQPEKVGTGRLNIVMMPILDVTLFAPQAHWRPDAPFALQVTFLRPLQGHKLAGHALDEMRHIGLDGDPHLNVWGQKLSAVLPDVTRGDVLTGVRDAAGGTSFFMGAERLGHFADPSFSDAFFGICLSPRTSQPALRREVLGLERA